MAVSGYASTAMVQKWMNLKSKNPSIDLGDFVTCCNCGRIMLVNVGTNVCPECNEKLLIWADENS